MRTQVLVNPILIRGYAAMMRYAFGRAARGTVTAAPPSSRFDGYQFSLFAPPATAARSRARSDEPYSIRAVTPSLRPLAARTGNRCPECAGPLVNGEGSVACPVCGFTRHGW
jgi:hypothetical protein